MFGHFCSWFLDGHHQKAFFNVTVFNLNVSSYHSLYHKFKKEYGEQQIREVEMALLTPLIFLTTGDMSGAITVFNKSYVIPEEIIYSVVILWVCCRLSS